MSNDLTKDIKIIERLIPNENLRNLIFTNDNYKDDQFLCNKDTLFKYFNTIIEIAFFFTYSRYFQWKQNLNNRYIKYDPNYGSKNFNRIVSFFEKLYVDRDLNPDNISDVLIDLQIDLANSITSNDENREEVFQAINDFYLKDDIKRSHVYSECDYLAKQYLNQNFIVDNIIKESGKTVLQQRRDTLIELIKTFPFLKYITVERKPIANLKKISKDAQGGVIIEDSHELEEITFNYFNFEASEERNCYKLPDDIPLNFTLVATRNNYFYLEKIERNYSYKSVSYPALVFSYIKLANFPTAKHLFIINDETKVNTLPDGSLFIQDSSMFHSYENIFYNSGSNGIKSSLIKDFTAINFRYIKTLSLSICDLLTFDLKKHLFRRFGKAHGFLFNDADSNGILTEEEANKVDWDTAIAVLLVDESAVCVLRSVFFFDVNLLSKICLNLESRLGRNQFSAIDVQKQAEDEFASIKSKWTNIYRLDTIPYYVHNKFDDSELPIKTSVYSSTIIKKLASLSDRKNVKNAAFNANFPIPIRARIRLLSHIAESQATLKERIDGLVVLTNQTMMHLICFYEGFFKYASEMRRISKIHNNVVAVQKAANEAFINIYKKKYDEFSLPENFNSHYLVNAIAKLNNECRSPSNNPESNSKYNLTKYFLGRKEFVNMEVFEPLEYLSDIESEEEFTDAVKLANDLFEYLKTGSVEKGYQTNDTAIYPYIATYIFGQESRDGYTIKHFEILFEDNTDLNVKVLSEFQYKLNHRYYCLPSSLRFNKNVDVWIEPILIDYENFIVERKK